MLKPERMQQVSIIVAKDQLPNLLGYAGSKRLFHLTEIEDDSIPEGAKRYEALELQAKSSTIKSRLTILTTALNVSEATFENLDTPVNNIDALTRFLDEETGKLEHLVRELEAAEGKLQTEKEQASELSRFLSGLENVGVSLDAIAGRGFLTSLVGEAGPETIPTLQKDLDRITQGNLIFAITNTSEETQTFLAIFPADFQDDAKQVTTALGAKLGPPWTGLPSNPKKAKEAIDLKLADLEKESKNLEETRTRIAREQGSRIIALGTLSEILDARTKALSGASTTEATLLLQAWIPEAKSSEIAQEISKASGGLANMFVERKNRNHSTEESAHAKGSEPTTLVKAPGWTQPQHLHGIHSVFWCRPLSFRSRDKRIQQNSQQGIQTRPPRSDRLGMVLCRLHNRSRARRSGQLQILSLAQESTRDSICLHPNGTYGILRMSPSRYGCFHRCRKQYSVISPNLGSEPGRLCRKICLLHILRHHRRSIR